MKNVPQDANPDGVLDQDVRHAPGPQHLADPPPVLFMGYVEIVEQQLDRCA